MLHWQMSTLRYCALMLYWQMSALEHTVQQHTSKVEQHWEKFAAMPQTAAADLRDPRTSATFWQASVVGAHTAHTAHTAQWEHTQHSGSTHSTVRGTHSTVGAHTAQ